MKSLFWSAELRQGVDLLANRSFTKKHTTIFRKNMNIEMR